MKRRYKAFKITVEINIITSQKINLQVIKILYEISDFSHSDAN